ncbi:MAG: hypothetical protein RLZZ535_1454 [Cyanobacteriota bacterium]
MSFRVKNNLSKMRSPFVFKDDDGSIAIASKQKLINSLSKAIAYFNEQLEVV